MNAIAVAGIEYPLPPIPVIDDSMRFSTDQYFPEASAKRGIVLHHTVGGSARSTFEYWQNRERVGTAYQIDRDGTTYEHFNPSHWAYHLGLVNTKGRYDRETIGIELCSEGPLVPVDGDLHAYYNPKTGRGRVHTDPIVDLGTTWRGWRYFDAYSPEQVVSTLALVHWLLEQFPAIPRLAPANAWTFDQRWLRHGGVYGHAHVRTDKSDPHPLAPWRELKLYCRLEEVVG